MSISYLYDAAREEACLVETGTDCAFGPVLTDVAEREDMDRFVAWLRAHAELDDILAHAEERLPGVFQRWFAIEYLETYAAWSCAACDYVTRNVYDQNEQCPKCGAVAEWEEAERCDICDQVVARREDHLKCWIDDGSKDVSMRKKPPAPSVRRATEDQRKLA